MDFCSVKDQPGQKNWTRRGRIFLFLFSKSLLQFGYHKNCHIFLIIILKFYVLILLRLKENLKNLTILFRTVWVHKWFAWYNWPLSFSCVARCLKRQISCHNKCYIQLCHNRDPVPAKGKHVTNIETCTLLCCDHITLWKALDANMVENVARCSDKNIKILVTYQLIGW